MKCSKVLPLVLATTLATQVLADENTTSKFFAGVELGGAQHTIDISGAGANYKAEKGNSLAAGLALGYNINENWSVVAQYTSYGEADLFDVRLSNSEKLAFSTDTKGLSVVGQYMTTRNVGYWSLGAKLGLMRWDTDFDTRYTDTSRNFAYTYSQSDSGIAIYGGFLGAYAMNEKLDLTLGIDWFVNDLDVEFVNDASTDMQYTRLFAGLNYHW